MSGPKVDGPKWPILHLTAKMTNNQNITFFSAENRKVCMWDKNSVGCCTDNLELAHSWHDTGCIGRCSWNNPATLKVVAERGVPFNPSVIYALSDSPGIRNQFNFECPTHHPAIGFKHDHRGPLRQLFLTRYQELMISYRL